MYRSSVVRRIWHFVRTQNRESAGSVCSLNSESLNMSLREALKPRVAFPSEEAALKVMYLALRNVIDKWQRPPPLDRGDEQLHPPVGGSHAQGHWDIAAWFPSPRIISDTASSGRRQGSPLRSDRSRGKALTALFPGQIMQPVKGEGNK
jgi:hypothetical protein